MNSEFKKMQYLAGIKETKIGHPALIKFENLKIGDELIVKHTGSNNWGIKYNVGDIWKIIDITEGWMLAMGHMFYKLKHVNGNKDIHYLYDTEMKETVDSGVFGYYRKSKTNEAVIRDPRIKEIVDNIIILDKKFMDIILKMSYDNTNQMRLMSEFYDKYEKYGIVDALELGYDTLREELVKQPYKSLVQLYEELKLVMNKLPNTIGEMQVANPVFKLPEGWNEDEDVGQDPDNIWDGKIIKSWWAPMNGDDEEHADRIILVENDGQYYIHYLFAFSHDESEGPFSNKSEALKKILEVMNELMGHWNDPDEMF
jgi:hypothetical protein